VKLIASHNGPCYIRLPRPKLPLVYTEDYRFVLGKAVTMKQGKDATIISIGIMVAAALEAAEKLGQEGIDCRVLNMSTLKPIDEAAIIQTAIETGAIVTAEEHLEHGGLGSMVAQVGTKNKPVPMEMVAIKDTYAKSGKPAELLRRYGLTLDDFCLTYELNERDIQTRTRPFGLGTGSNLQTVECWTNHVRFDAQLRQTILLPNDLATHPCMQGQDPTESRRELLEHERLHEADNNRAAETTRTRLLTRLGFTLGIGPLMAMVRITDDQQGFVQECSRRIRGRLDQIRDEHDLIYHRLSTEYASILDPHDRELHSLKQRLLEEARARKSSQSLSGGP